MGSQAGDGVQTVALSTRLEEEFVSPLTAVRGALEILRDFPDLSATDRSRFIGVALRECGRLEHAIADLATTVYAAGQRMPEPPDDAEVATANRRQGHGARVNFLDKHDAVEVNLEDMEFDSSARVNEFHDVLERLIRATGRKWYFVVNYRGCRIWPEAWVAFAHRGKKMNTGYSLGTVRYVEPGEDGDFDGFTSADLAEPDTFTSRAAALEWVDERRRTGHHPA